VVGKREGGRRDGGCMRARKQGRWRDERVGKGGVGRGKEGKGKSESEQTEGEREGRGGASHGQ
jgi:hypothetical protein